MNRPSVFTSAWQSEEQVQTENAFAGNHPAPQWTERQANDWYAKQPWLVGCNFIPSTAINQLEMWQSETWDPQTIDRELGWAADLGMNTIRVFLHDLVYRNDPDGLKMRFYDFLTLCDKHDIRPMVVLFDSVWDPEPKAGLQPAPKAGLHNSGWVQSPGKHILGDRTQWHLVKPYVVDMISTFRIDNRILLWDIVNEPDNDNLVSYGKAGLNVELQNKQQMGTDFVKEAFQWAREAQPTQPITSGPWYGDWSSLETMSEMDRFLFTHSDVITFHNYLGPEEFERCIEYLKVFNRPILCTEYMARNQSNTFETILPIAQKHQIGMYNWGFVSGKSHTIYPWDSWQKPYADEPSLWFHDIFREDGSAYKPEEVAFIKKILGKETNVVALARTAMLKKKSAEAEDSQLVSDY